jgi:Leucine-rich repeat (LRR) protein
MLKYSSLFLLVFLVVSTIVRGQSTVDSLQLKKEFFSLEEALENPESVYRLNLSNQNLEFSDIIWSQFINLQYLSLKNDHLKQIPTGIGYLKNLMVLDLSGNDFRILPSTFDNLIMLEELYLNDEKYFSFKQNIPILSTMPNLRSLHIENDGLKSLPKDISRLIHLESLYINNNKFKKLPTELNGLENLQYLDFHDNKFKLPEQNSQNQDFRFRIRF